MTAVPSSNLTKAFGPPAAVVFGLDAQGKAHASTFVADEIELASRAAGLMGLKLLIIDDAKQALANACPRSRAFASGKVFSPFVARPLFDQLCAAAGVTVAELSTLRASATPAKPVAVKAAPIEYDVPADRGAITIASLVLATEGGFQAGWFESVVVEVEGDTVRLRWRDWPEEEEFVRHRDQLGLLPLLAA